MALQQLNEFDPQRSQMSETQGLVKERMNLELAKGSDSARNSRQNSLRSQIMVEQTVEDLQQDIDRQLEKVEVLNIVAPAPIKDVDHV